MGQAQHRRALRGSATDTQGAILPGTAIALPHIGAHNGCSTDGVSRHGAAWNGTTITNRLAKIITDMGCGTATAASGARVVSLGARFNC